MKLKGNLVFIWWRVLVIEYNINEQACFALDSAMFLLQTQIKVFVSSAEIYPIYLSSEGLFSHSSGCLAIGKEKMLI